MLCRFIGIVGFKQDRGFFCSRIEMPVETIFSNIEFCTFKPTYFRLFKIPAQHLVPASPPQNSGFSHALVSGPEKAPGPGKSVLQVGEPGDKDKRFLRAASEEVWAGEADGRRR